MNGDGTDQTNLSNNPASDASPSISPNGQRITFQSTRDDPPGPNQTGEIYVMDADGTTSRGSPTTPHTTSRPQFSPNGQKIVFMSRRATAYMQIWIMDANGSNPVQLTNNTNGESTNPNRILLRTGDPVHPPTGLSAHRRRALLQRRFALVADRQSAQRTGHGFGE